MFVDLWLPTRLSRNRHVGDYSREVGQHPVAARDANLTENALPAEVASRGFRPGGRLFGHYEAVGQLVKHRLITC